MGFDTIISQMVFYIFLITVIVGAYAIIADMSIDNNKIIVEEQNRMMLELQTSVTLGNITYNSTDEQVTFQAVNSGKTMLKTDLLDIYVDGMRIPRNDTNRSIAIISEEIINPGLWDPDEEIEIVVNKGLDAGIHSVRIVSQYSSQDITSFNT